MRKIVFLLCFASTLSNGQSIFDNVILGTKPQMDNPFTIGQNIDPNISVSGIGYGPGVDGHATSNNQYSVVNWDSQDLNLEDYFEFTLSPNPSFKIDFVSFIYNGISTDRGPTHFAFKSSLDGFTEVIGTAAASASINLSSYVFQDVTSPITFRLYAWGAGHHFGAFSIFDFVFNGVVSLIPCPNTSTWNGISWDNGYPDITKHVVLDASYNTEVNGGSFSACSVTVNTSGTVPENNILTVSEGHYVEVQNSIVAHGNIVVQPFGTIVQVDDIATVLGNGSIEVLKKTAKSNNWYEYTYWSTPVKNETIDNALRDSNPQRRFVFKAENYLDTTAEMDNNNEVNPGQDNVDDNADDWNWVGGETLMIPGVGYASTHDKSIFENSLDPHKQFIYRFKGSFNNGIITVPIYRNDSNLEDFNWNFIGNPYPSAIDADLFLSTNRIMAHDEETIINEAMDGAIFLWSQNTAASVTANGNEQLNFSNEDYAIINAVGEIPGGDGVTPSRHIPSGQGFFVSMSNTAFATLISSDVYKTNIVFNNAMRVKDAVANSLFFKNSNTNKGTPSIANKLWLNLTSDHGVFNQILVGYVNGATNLDDGIAFDTHKYPVKGAAIYSRIANSNKKYAIQGKDIHSIHDDEEIAIGFSSTIKVPTVYKLSLANLQGDFLTNTTIYLEDTMLNKIHNLSGNDYRFTSEIGEFNNRFKICFRANALSMADQDSEKNKLSIVHLNDHQVQFTVSTNLKIKTVSIYNLLGHQLYSFNGQSSSEIFSWSSLQAAVYIAKVRLSNDVVITKKTIKK
ncbi:T9SS type A sorting domain-containing protein [Mariniflexile ostreae]|uniref:T9SS type A sorting domain-containing protein n=1 Tax=Mariniflexile ostreae TaxID=1520892 RepID=A0ABV5FB65_9FLAO